MTPRGMMQTFFIGCRLPGLNEMLASARASRGKWQRFAEEKVLYESLIKFDIKHSKLRPVSCRVVLHFHWIEPNKRRDYGNIRCGEKFISDALVTMGILTTDARSQVVGFMDTFEVDNEHPGVRVTIEEQP